MTTIDIPNWLIVVAALAPTVWLLIGWVVGRGHSATVTKHHRTLPRRQGEMSYRIDLDTAGFHEESDRVLAELEKIRLAQEGVESLYGPPHRPHNLPESDIVFHVPEESPMAPRWNGRTHEFDFPVGWDKPTTDKETTDD